MKCFPLIFIIDFSNNPLQDIWFGTKQSDVYPPFLWSLLTDKSMNTIFGISYAEDAKRRWMKFAFRGHVAEKDIALFFEKGGLYTEDNLQTRIELLNTLFSILLIVDSELENYRSKILQLAELNYQ